MAKRREPISSAASTAAVATATPSLTMLQPCPDCRCECERPAEPYNVVEHHGLHPHTDLPYRRVAFFRLQCARCARVFVSREYR